MIHVVAIITTKPGKREEVLAAFNKIVPTVLAEDGCIEYGPTIDATDAPSIQTPIGANSFIVIEKWTSSKTLEAHGASSHMAAYGQQVKNLIVSRTIHVLASAW